MAMACLWLDREAPWSAVGGSDGAPHGLPTLQRSSVGHAAAPAVSSRPLHGEKRCQGEALLEPRLRGRCV